MAQGVTTITYGDFGNEKSAVRIRGIELTAANFDAQVTASVAVQDAIAAMTIGQKQRVVYANDNQISSAAAASALAQREVKWLVSFTDDTNGKKGTLEIPCADLTLLPAGGSELLDLTDTEAAAFVSAFESYARSADGNTVTVDQIAFVARNL